MHHHYADIRSRIAEEPKWFDENAVPRYCDFSPDELANIYAIEAALVEIACQECGRRFFVAFALDQFDARRISPLSEQIIEGWIHYGDPPNVDCCPAGPMMNSKPCRVVEFWRKTRDTWQRDRTLEINLGV